MNMADRDPVMETEMSDQKQEQKYSEESVSAQKWESRISYHISDQEGELWVVNYELV